jgi:hypothetical protein
MHLERLFRTKACDLQYTQLSAAAIATAATVATAIATASR